MKPRHYFLGFVVFMLWFTLAVAEPAPQHDYKILRVLDGDTIEIEADFLPLELDRVLKVRILGIDTPEKHPRAKCDAEDDLAHQATAFAKELIDEAKVKRVVLKGWDKYGGRVLGDIILDGKSLSELMIETDHAIAYHGEKKDHDWCVAQKN